MLERDVVEMEFWRESQVVNGSMVDVGVVVIILNWVSNKKDSPDLTSYTVTLSSLKNNCVPQNTKPTSTSAQRTMSENNSVISLIQR